ncbi:MAG: serine hydrolase domain-containing protein [Solirubrobacteraceae bacterium]
MSVGLASGVEEILERAATDGVVPGAVFAQTGPDGDVVQATAGKLRIDEEGPVTTATMFRLMSMTKALATAGALQLVEQGKLDLEQEVAAIIPAFGELKVLEGFDGDQPRLRAPVRQATVAELMTHTAGHGYGFSNANLLRYLELTGLPDPFSGLRAGLGAPLVADPGTEWNYGINTDWLGQVIESVSGQDLDSYLKEHLFSPLGMSDTTFSLSEEQRSRMMAIHARTPDGGLAVMDMEAPVVQPEFWPAGHGAYSTAGDYARFMAALLNGGELGGERVLRRETVELMFTDHLKGVSLPDGIKSEMPELANDVPPLPFAQGFGLGLHLFAEDLPGMRRAGSGDWSGLMNCYYWIDPASDIACVFLTQVLPFYDAAIVEAGLAMEQAVYAGI